MHPVLIYAITYVVAQVGFLVLAEAFIPEPMSLRLLIGVPGGITVLVGTYLVRRFPFKDPMEGK